MIPDAPPLAPPRRVFLQRQPDGTLIDWGRHATVSGVRGEGPARWFTGEAAEVMALVLRHTKPQGRAA